MMKVIVDGKEFKDFLDRILVVNNEVNITAKEGTISAYAVSPDQVYLVDTWIDAEVEKEGSAGIDVKELKRIVKSADEVGLELKDNRLRITKRKGTNISRFTVPVTTIEEGNKLDYEQFKEGADKVTVEAGELLQIIEDAGTIGAFSTTLCFEDGRFKVKASSEMSEYEGFVKEAEGTQSVIINTEILKSCISKLKGNIVDLYIHREKPLLIQATNTVYAIAPRIEE